VGEQKRYAVRVSRTGCSKGGEQEKDVVRVKEMQSRQAGNQ
jgi:hypothetical protein